MDITLRVYPTKISVRFGEPIDIGFIAKRYLSAQDGNASRAIIKDMTAEVEKRLIGLTINAPDWYVYVSSYLATC